MPAVPTSVRHASARRVDVALSERGLSGRVRELPDSTATAAEAASAIGCDVRQIVKSLLFRTRKSRHPVLVLSSGSHRVDEEWMRHFAEEPLVRADPEYVRSVTGFAIGGVPPVGLAAPLIPFVDYDLLELNEIWAAAGHPHAVCRLTPAELLRITRGRPVPVVPLSRPDEVPWITFDCYGTLIDWRTGLLEQVGRLTRGRTQQDRLFAAYLREERAIESGPYLPYRTVVAEAILRATQAEGIPLSREVAERIPESIPHWPAFGDTRSALNSLVKRGFHIGVLSNVDSDLMNETLHNLGVKADRVVTAEEVRSYKPMFKHWIHFLKLTGAQPEEVLHVSASVEHDIEPAMALGFRTAYVTRYGDLPSGQNVGRIVHGLTELLDQTAALAGKEPVTFRVDR